MIQDKSRNVGLITLGCAKNRVDSEVMLGLLRQAGWNITADMDEAGLIIINTCAFIQAARDEAYSTIDEIVEWKCEEAGRRVIVCGCLSQRYAGELTSRYPEVDAWVGIGDFDRIVEIAGSASDKCMYVGSNAQPLHGCLPRVLTTPQYSAYMKIADGCNNRCHYCAIPLIRGPLRSREPGGLIEEAKQLRRDGVRELNVTAQDLTAYGTDCGSSLTELLTGLNEVGFDWIRLLYCYPDRVDDKLIDLVAADNHIIPYMDIPVQHISDRLLRTMNRKLPSEAIRSMVLKLRERVPGIILRTTFIVGYPGETDEDVAELLDFIKEYPFDRAGAFIYSPEEGTVGATLPGRIPAEVSAERYKQIMMAQGKASKRLARKRIGSEAVALIEEVCEDGSCIGRTYGEAPEVDGSVYIFGGKNISVGDMVKMRITNVYDYELAGEVI